MHFSKTYAQLLSSLPIELRENAIQYRQLKKLINQIVRELSSLGLSPTLLQEHLERSKDEIEQLAKKYAKGNGEGSSADHDPSTPDHTIFGHSQLSKVVYELSTESGHPEPHLKLWLEVPSAETGSSSPLTTEDETPSSQDEAPEDVAQEGQEEGATKTSLLWALQRKAAPDGIPEVTVTEEVVGETPSVEIAEHDDHPDSTDLSEDDTIIIDSSQNKNEVVIRLTADLLFFNTLSNALEQLSDHMATVHSDFVDTLASLANTIADAARPVSQTAPGFKPHSVLSSQPWSVRNASHTKSDLYSWREIFQLYVEAEVFESVHEMDRGERSLEEAEKRLSTFAERVSQRGLGDSRKLKLKSSRAALESFLELNLLILNVKKFQFANSEATRKILKKHTKRTSLPLPADTLIPKTRSSLPRIFVQAIGETLLPVIPHLDDYACLICTSIAFKPIRLTCGHLFCVRCLVKMQKRGKANCPMCRAPCVLTADRSSESALLSLAALLMRKLANVDWALLNFMQDWFPVEAKEKLKQNEKEAAREELEEMGVDPDQSCLIM